MRELQSAIIEELGVRPEIDPAQEVSRRVDFLADYLGYAGAQGFVLGISGGVDSTLAGRLCQLAVEKLRAAGTQARFHGVRLPHGIQHDEDDAARAMDFVAPDDPHTFNISTPVAGLDAAYANAMGGELSDYNRGNVKARMRMIVQYAIAGEHSLLVAGADHAGEAITGFFTKHGDGGADIMPLSGLNKRQVRRILQHLEAEEALWDKASTADLLDEHPGQLDETELGVTYYEIDDYLEGREVPTAVAEKLEQGFLASRHKRHVPVGIQDTWWRDS